MEDVIQQELVYVDINGKEHQIYPMLLKDMAKVNRLFMKIDDTYLYLNLPTPKLNRKKEIIIDKKTKEPVMDTSSYDAMMTLFSMALDEPIEELEQWIDLKNGVQILDEYRQISGLKKKLNQTIMGQILQTLSPQ